MITYGQSEQIQFQNTADLCRAIGYLCRNTGATSLHFEKNEECGAWGNEGRIHFHIDNPKIPGYWKYTAGNGSTKSRVNCNDFFILLINLGFQEGYTQDSKQIRANLACHPQYAQYLCEFNAGLQIKD